MKKSLALILVFAGFIWSCQKNTTLNPEEKIGPKTFKIQVGTDPATISIPNVIEMIIPQGAFDGAATITITPLSAATLPFSSDFELIETFDITSSSGRTFARNLEINIKYDPKKGKNGARLNGAAWYNEDVKKWVRFSDVIVDTVRSEIRIKTNHLCKLGRLSYTGKFGYTDWSSSLHFYYYWSEPGILTNDNYDSPYRAANVGNDPWYIQDIQHYMEEAWTAYKKANLYLPDGKINVYITNLPSGSDGETSYLGCIYINQNILSSKYATTAEYLPMACAHELLHYSQDYYYMLLFTEYTIKWWLEATAVQADRLVWPSNKKFEVIDYGQNLYNNLSLSWDNCNGDPEYYVAGSFLSYLITYRPGARLNLSDIVMDGGKATDISYMRTILDNSIKSKLSSSGIGEEFANFIKWVIDGKSDIKLATSSPTPTPQRPNFYNSIFTAKDQKQTHNVTVPHLATAFFKALNKTNEKQTMIAKVDSKSDQIVTLAYKMNSNGASSFIKELNAKDSILIDLADVNEWVEIVGINKNKDSEGTASVSFRFNTIPPMSDATLKFIKLKKYFSVWYDIDGKFSNGETSCIWPGDGCQGDGFNNLFEVDFGSYNYLPIVWTGGNFTATKGVTNGTFTGQWTISGTILDDGTIANLNYTFKDSQNDEYSFKVEGVKNPLLNPDPLNPDLGSVKWEWDTFHPNNGVLKEINITKKADPSLGTLVSLDKTTFTLFVTFADEY